jgi:hypothetical protein
MMLDHFGSGRIRARLRQEEQMSWKLSCRPICTRLHHGGDSCQICQFATYAVLSPSEVLVYEPEFAPVEGMKDMRNQEGLCPIKQY